MPQISNSKNLEITFLATLKQLIDEQGPAIPKPHDGDPKLTVTPQEGLEQIFPKKAERFHS